MKILVVEDDRKVAGFIEQGLREEGHVVGHAGTERTGYRFHCRVLDEYAGDPDGPQRFHAFIPVWIFDCADTGVGGGSDTQAA